MSEPTITEVLEFLRDNVPTKSELVEWRQHVDEQFQHVEERLDELEGKLDVRERVRLIERRLAKLEDAGLSGPGQLTPQA